MWNYVMLKLNITIYVGNKIKIIAIIITNKGKMKPKKHKAKKGGLHLLGCPNPLIRLSHLPHLLLRPLEPRDPKTLIPYLNSMRRERERERERMALARDWRRIATAGSCLSSVGVVRGQDEAASGEVT